MNRCLSECFYDSNVMNGAINRVCSEVFNRKCEKYT